MESITGATIPYGPIEIAQGLQAKPGSSNATNINWDRIVILGLGLIGGTVLAVLISNELKKRLAARTRPQYQG